MGSKCAPTYACLFMGWLETQMLQSWSNQRPNSKPHLWRRHIDDIVFIWHGSTDELDEFMEHTVSEDEYGPIGSV